MDGCFVPPSGLFAVPNYEPPADEYREDAETLEARCSGMIRGGCLPTVDVVQVDGRHFAVNNDWLATCQKFEKAGVCNAVKINVVPESSVPDDMRKAIDEALASNADLYGKQAYTTFTEDDVVSSDDGGSLNNRMHSSSGSDWSLSDENDSSDKEITRDSDNDQAEALIH